MLFKKTTFKSEIGSENDEASFSPEKGTFVVVDSSHLQSARVWDVVRARRFFRSRAPSVAWYTAASRATRSHSWCRLTSGGHPERRFFQSRHGFGKNICISVIRKRILGRASFGVPPPSRVQAVVLRGVVLQGDAARRAGQLELDLPRVRPGFTGKQPACRGGAGVHARWRYVFPIYHVLPPCLQPLFDVHSLKGSILLVTLTSTVLASLTNISQVRCLRNTSYEHGPKD